MRPILWPDPQAILDVMSELVADHGHTLQLRAPDDFYAGLDRAKTAYSYAPESDIAELANLIFEGLATRHPLVDGNKRLAWLTMTTFLDMNGAWFDPSELDAFHIAMAVIKHEKSRADLAQFIRDHLRTTD